MSENKRGRPLKFKTVKALQDAIDKYFADCEGTGEPLTVTGLALALETTRDEMCIRDRVYTLNRTFSIRGGEKYIGLHTSGQKHFSLCPNFR